MRFPTHSLERIVPDRSSSLLPLGLSLGVNRLEEMLASPHHQLRVRRGCCAGLTPTGEFFVLRRDDVEQ
jgi:hypothetical protein